MNYGLNLSNPAPVLSVSIIDKNTLSENGVITPESNILVGVRCALTHLTHPDVVSIPTQRIPEKLLDDYYEEGIETGVEEITLPVLASEIFKIQPGKNYAITDESSSHDPLKYAVESILSKKLLLGQALEEKKITFTAEPAIAITGFVLYEKTGDTLPGVEVEVEGRKFFKEYLTMYNIMVKILNIEYIPADTPSYSDVRWAKIRDFIRMVETKNVEVLHSLFGNRSIQICVHGLCLASAYLYLKINL